MATCVLLGGCHPSAKGSQIETVELLHVSYDSTRELFDAYDALFIQHWQASRQQAVKIRRSHAGSGKQARAVLDGLTADVVSLSLAYDVDQLEQQPVSLPRDWQSRLPDGSSPFTSPIVFLVRRGNPRNIHDWSDLIRPGVGVIAPNPKTSGAARWIYLAAWGAARAAPGGSDASALDFVRELYRHVLVLDAGARGSATTFTRNLLGDVLLTWESEALTVMSRLEADGYERIVPSMSIRAEPVVAWVDRTIDRHHTRPVAEEYLRYLYSDEAQEVIATHGYRPRSSAVLQRWKERFPSIELLNVTDAFGGWSQANATHFAAGGTFDSIYEGRQ